MIKARTWLALLMLSVGTLFATASCGSDEATGTGAGAGDAGEGSLITAGSGGKGGSSSVGRAGASSNSGGESGSGTGAIGVGTLGAMCSLDADCAAGLTCWAPDSTELGGGPQNGLCTAACTQNSECDTIEAGAACVIFGDNSYCMEACEPGQPIDDSTKCQGRSDFACQDLGKARSPRPFCLPLCQADAACGTGLFCDLKSGLCGKTKPTGSPVGTPCDPNATTDICAGYCIPTSATDVTPETGNCMEVCSGGSGCMWSSTSDPTPGGFCYAGGTLGDLGICQPSCECDSDCKFPGDLCRAWASTTIEQSYKTALGADGLCFPNTLDSVELDCGAGGAGGAGGSGGSN